MGVIITIGLTVLFTIANEVAFAPASVPREPGRR